MQVWAKKYCCGQYCALPFVEQCALCRSQTASSRVSLEQHKAADRFPEELHLDIVYNKSVGLKLNRTQYYSNIDDWSLAMTKCVS